MLQFKNELLLKNKELKEVFAFFSEAKNLEAITPAFLEFKISNISTPAIEEGTRISYKLKIHGFPAKWESLIKNWNPPHEFMDIQLRGPYKTWEHTHRFEKTPEGVLISDLVNYELPFGPLGLIAKPFVTKDIEKIFLYRNQQVLELI